MELNWITKGKFFVMSTIQLKKRRRKTGCRVLDKRVLKGFRRTIIRKFKNQNKTTEEGVGGRGWGTMIHKGLRRSHLSVRTNTL